LSGSEEICPSKIKYWVTFWIDPDAFSRCATQPHPTQRSLT
jgi:hypothetical protein